MKIVLITDYTPTEDNYNGPSAITYHLLKELENLHEVYIYTTNSNKVPKEIITKTAHALKGKLKVKPRSLWMKLLISRKTHFFFNWLFKENNITPVSRYKLPSSILKEINLINPDLILIYPYFLIRVQKQLQKFNIASIGPDCYSLHSIRSFQDSYLYSTKKVTKECKDLSKHITLEQKITQYSNKILLVGIADNTQYKIITGNKDKSFFIPHPHYKIKEKDINFDQNKNLKIIITGKYDQYTYSDINILLKELIQNGSQLSFCQFTFLGKTWKPIVSQLRNHINVSLKEWVDDYVEEIIKYDIQICPISLGTGTKGKVLDALANGLLCIGSKYAFENIAVENNKSCIQYENANEIVGILQCIQENKKYYKEIAEHGRSQVRKFHSPNLIANILLELTMNNRNIINFKEYAK